MLGDGLGAPTCVIGSPKVGRESYPYHLAGSPLIVGLAIQNTDSSDSMVAAIERRAHREFEVPDLTAVLAAVNRRAPERTLRRKASERKRRKAAK